MLGDALKKKSTARPTSAIKRPVSATKRPVSAKPKIATPARPISATKPVRPTSARPARAASSAKPKATKPKVAQPIAVDLNPQVMDAKSHEFKRYQQLDKRL